MKNTHFLFIAPGVDPAAAFPGWRLAQIEGAQAKTTKAFYSQIAEALDFPDYFGHNLDSLDELLNDLQWIKEDKIVLFIQDSAAWLSAEKSDDKLTTLIDLLEATAEDWKWLDEDEENDLAKKELRILFEDSPRIRTLLEEQEIPFGVVG
ncbi:barstar family protein [Salmonirosea aquatica]|uniref:Barnase inhibitor n=1 Tax=Salmonirosea aquatica TaxID=2654236 RepID=A0A7C9BAJ0_9BACT|nr:barnase inhibitor [Cytophagaceae bacterium SJW1-29]